MFLFVVDTCLVTYILLTPDSSSSLSTQHYHTLGECTPTVSGATDCAVVKSSIYLTTDTGHEDEARVNALSMIHHRLGRGTYEEGSILHTSYLGPDMNFRGGSHDGHQEVIYSAGSTSLSSSHHPPLFYAAIVMVSLAVCALIAFLVIAWTVHKERKKREVSSSFHTSSGSSCHRSSVRAVEDLHLLDQQSYQNRQGF